MWLEGKRWDVIHFNWGLHDLTLLDDGYQVGIDQYTANLRSLVRQLKSTGARLIWATTTPVQIGAERRSPKDPGRYNDAARKIMEEQAVPTDDLTTRAAASRSCRFLTMFTSNRPVTKS
jgi:acyl-CoA thioesterase-1